MKIRGLVLGCALLCLTLALAACARSGAQVREKVVTVVVPVVETRMVERSVVVTATPAPTPAYVSRRHAPAGTLRYPLAAEPQTLDPQAVADESGALAVQQLYEGLYRVDGQGNLAPAAAAGYEMSADGRVYTVTLRAGLSWEDGQPVTAQHYVDGLCRGLDPATGSSQTQRLASVAAISGVAAYASGAAAGCTEIGAQAVNTRTLRFTLDRPVSALPALWATQAFLPARLDGRAHFNGPYVLAEWARRSRLVLTRNPHYWNAAHVGIERIEMPVMSSAAGGLAQYDAGDLDAVEVQPDALAPVESRAGLARELHIVTRPGVSYLALNTQSAPTADVNFRRAVVSAIDRSSLITNTLGEPWHRPAQGFLPPGLPGYAGSDGAAGYPYNPAAAAKFLAQAGYGPDNPPPPVDIWTNSEGSNLVMAQGVVAMLERAGIPARLVAGSWDTYLSSLGRCRAAADRTGCGYGLYRMAWVMDYPDPASLLAGVFGPDAAANYTGWNSAQYTALLAEAAAAPDPARRVGLYRQAEKALLDDAVVAPILYYDRAMLVKEGVAFEYPPFGPPEFQFWKTP